MRPGNVGATMGVRCNGKARRSIIVSQRNGAGSIAHNAGSANADIRRIDTDEIDCIAKGEAAHHALEMCDIVELQRSGSALK